MSNIYFVPLLTKLIFLPQNSRDRYVSLVTRVQAGRPGESQFYFHRRFGQN